MIFNAFTSSLSFVGPAMSDAISNLGGGGLSTPYLANLANSLQYMAGCLITLFGGPLINKFGIKWSCIIAAVAMPLAGSAFYVSAKYRVDWYLLVARVGGVRSALVHSTPNDFIAVRRIRRRLPLRRRDDRYVVIPKGKR